MVDQSLLLDVGIDGWKLDFGEEYLPDTFETFEARDGKAVLKKREEDLNGDGEIDVTSLYRNGKLYRREILDPDLVPGA